MFNNNIDFSDLVPPLLAKREVAQQEYELALADFERAKRVLEAAGNLLGRVNNMLGQCGYVEEPQPEVEAVVEETAVEQPVEPNAPSVY